MTQAAGEKADGCYREAAALVPRKPVRLLMTLALNEQL